MKQMNKIKITFNSPVILGFVFASFVVLILGCLTEGAAIKIFDHKVDSDPRLAETFNSF